MTTIIVLINENFLFTLMDLRRQIQRSLLQKQVAASESKIKEKGRNTLRFKN